jgi:2-methylcitrate dehydratase
MSEAAPIMRSGFDHTTQQAFSVAAGVAKALRMGVEQTADALAISGVDSVSLAVNRAEPMSQWKGLASADQASRSIHNTLLARRGITGPRVVFEGPKGFMEALEADFEIRWEAESLDVLPRTLVKKFNAEVHSQSTLEAVVDLRSAHSIDPAAVAEIDVRVFRTAYDIIGGGEFGPKGHARYKESADHDLTYLAAVALIDGEVYPEQHAPQRINRGDVQSLMKRVKVSPKRAYTRQYPDKMMCDVTIHMEGGESHTTAKSDYEGFPTRPMSWQTVEAKFHRLARPFMEEPIRKRLAAAVRELESIRVGDLCALLSRADGADAAGRGDQ